MLEGSPPVWSVTEAVEGLRGSVEQRSVHFAMPCVRVVGEFCVELAAMTQSRCDYFRSPSGFSHDQGFVR